MRYRFLIAALLGLVGGVAAAAFHADGPEYNGKQVTCDLPQDMYRRNTASKGLGNCVWTSLFHAAMYQNVPALYEFPKWLIDNGIEGGGYPSKVSALIPRICKSRNLPEPRWIQHTGGEMDFLDLAIKTGRMPSVTYDGRDGVFYNQRIAHMLNLVYLDSTTAALVDNNYPSKTLWCSRQEFEERWRGNGGGWAVVLLSPPPPPAPTNKEGVTPVGCPGGNCFSRAPSFVPAPPVFAPPPVAAPRPQAVPQGTYEWREGERGNKHLYLGGRLVGNYHAAWEEFNEYKGDGTWAKASLPPAAIPGGVTPVVENFGVDLSRIPREKSYSLNGTPCDKRKAFESLKEGFEGGLEDDSQKLRLTYVGANPEAFLRDWETAGELAGYREKVLVQAYPANHWATKDREGAPMYAEGLTLTKAPGKDGRAKELMYLTSYSGPTALFAALRKADPSYTPGGGNTPALPDLSSLWAQAQALPTWAWCGLAFLLLFYFNRAK